MRERQAHGNSERIKTHSFIILHPLLVQSQEMRAKWFYFSFKPCQNIWSSSNRNCFQAENVRMRHLFPFSHLNTQFDLDVEEVQYIIFRQTSIGKHSFHWSSFFCIFSDTAHDAKTSCVAKQNRWWPVSNICGVTPPLSKLKSQRIAGFIIL